MARKKKVNRRNSKDIGEEASALYLMLASCVTHDVMPTLGTLDRLIYRGDGELPNIIPHLRAISNWCKVKPSCPPLHLWLVNRKTGLPVYMDEGIELADLPGLWNEIRTFDWLLEYIAPADELTDAYLGNLVDDDEAGEVKKAA